MKSGLRKVVAITLCMMTMIVSSMSVCAAEGIDSQNENTRQVVCCNDMDKTTGYYEYHSAQEGNYPMCTVTRMKVTYCRNCNVIFSNTKIGTYEHEHADAF